MAVTLLFLSAMVDLPQSFLKKLETLRVVETSRILVVSVAEQKLTLFEARHPKSEYSISTARNGTGQKVDSYQTPLGLHRIKEKIGADAPWGAIFESREFKGEIWTSSPSTSLPHLNPQKPKNSNFLEDESASPDLTTTRILWLEGLETGINAGSDPDGILVDSYQRFIYIHGTNHENHIGNPTSRGCIRMLNSEMITLFDQVEEGDLVWIQK